jgi:primosomal replication protein N
MAPLHHVYFLGTVIQAPTMGATPNGTAVAQWGLAVPTRQRQGDPGHADVCRIEVRAFGPQAALVHAALRPGCTVLIEGRVQWWRSGPGRRARPTQAVRAERIRWVSPPPPTPEVVEGDAGRGRGEPLGEAPSMAAALVGEGERGGPADGARRWEWGRRPRVGPSRTLWAAGTRVRTRGDDGVRPHALSRSQGLARPDVSLADTWGEAGRRSEG